MYKLSKSPKPNKKFRVVTPEGTSLDFGAAGYSDYTIHKDPFRMRRYVGRHGGGVSKQLKKESNPAKVNKKMEKVITSSKENWTKNGLNTAGFWSRWLLWSKPSVKEAKQFIMKKFEIQIK